MLRIIGIYNGKFLLSVTLYGSPMFPCIFVGNSDDIRLKVHPLPDRKAMLDQSSVFQRSYIILKCFMKFTVSYYLIILYMCVANLQSTGIFLNSSNMPPASFSQKRRWVKEQKLFCPHLFCPRALEFRVSLSPPSSSDSTYKKTSNYCPSLKICA